VYHVFERWWWRRMEKFIWTDRVRNELLNAVKEDGDVPRKVHKRKANWIGHILRRNCLLKHVIEGKIEEIIEVTGRRGRIRKQLLNDLKEKRGYCRSEALDHTVWRTCFGRGYGPVVRHYGLSEE
jgi:hypothetical protein